MVFALVGGFCAILKKYMDLNMALKYADYYGIHRSLLYDNTSTLGLIIKILVLVLSIMYCMPSIFSIINHDYLKPSNLELVTISGMAGFGFVILLNAIDLEEFFYNKYPDSYKIISNWIYIIVFTLVLIITYIKLKRSYKEYKHTKPMPDVIERFRNYYIVGLSVCAIIAIIIVYLVFPGYTQPKYVNTYPVVENSTREDKTFDVLISNLDGGRAIFMRGHIDEEEKDSTGKDVIVFEKYKYFVDALDKKEFILKSFDYNKVVEDDDSDNEEK